MEKGQNEKFLQSLSLDGGFLQSQQWMQFQEKAGRPIMNHEEKGFIANCITHKLPIVGEYWYCPRGPVMTSYEKHTKELFELARKAKENGISWIRVEPSNETMLRELQNIFLKKIVKAPYDVQPKEIFVIDISKEEQAILSGMKSKTRYNIGLAEKRGVKISSCNTHDSTCQLRTQDFLRLTEEMARRQGIAAHPAKYYETMIRELGNMLKIYVAEYEGKVIAANLVLFFGKHATYLHGASSNEHRNVMAPYLLQWHAIKDAKKLGCEKYDFGGVSTNYKSDTNVRITNKWAGITGFKLGFSTSASPIVFPGTYDIIVNSQRYAMYRGLQKAKMFIKKIGK